MSALALALMFACVKWVGHRGAGVAKFLFYRQIGLPLAPGHLSRFHHRLPVAADAAPPCPRDADGDRVVAMLLNFLMVTLLPLAEATAIGFSVPIFATLLAAILLGEPTGNGAGAR